MRKIIFLLVLFSANFISLFGATKKILLEEITSTG